MKQEDQEKKGSLLFRLLQAKQKNEHIDLGDISQITSNRSAPEEDAPFENVPEDSLPPVPPPAVPEADTDSWVNLLVPPLSWDPHHRLQVQVNKTATKARLFLRPPAQDEPETCSIECFIGF